MQKYMDAMKRLKEDSLLMRNFVLVRFFFDKFLENFCFRLIDMSGGIAETIELGKICNSLQKGKASNPIDKKSLWKILIQAREKFSVIGCYIQVI